MKQRVRKYLRYSSDEQSTGWSIEAQDDICDKFIAGHSDWEFTGRYVDEGISGTTTDRADFQRMLEDAHSGEFDILVCAKLDRFSRSLVDIILTINDLKDHDVLFASATEQFDFTTPLGKLVLFIIGFFAQWYVENLSIETAKGKHARWNEGYWNGHLRFGYDKQEVGETVRKGKVKKLYKPVPNADAAGVSLAYDLCGQGKVDEEVGNVLNRRGFRTYRLISNAKKLAGPQTDLALRRPWTKDGVAGLFNFEAAQFYLGNLVYIGEIERRRAQEQGRKGEPSQPNYQIKTNTHEPVITQMQYDAAMAMRRMRTGTGNGMHQPKNVYLLQGIACCDECGLPLRSTAMGQGRDNLLLYYQCAAHQRGTECKAPRKLLREDVLKPQLDELMMRLPLPEDWRARAEQLIQEQPRDGGDVDAERAAVERELERLKFQHRKGIIDDDQMVEEGAPLVRRLKQLKPQTPVQVFLAGELLLSIRSGWERASQEQRSEMLHAMLDRVFIHMTTGAVVAIVPDRHFAPLFQLIGLEEKNSLFVLEKPQGEHVARLVD